MSRIPNIDKITTFEEVFNWVVYDLDHNHKLSKDNCGCYYVNKLYIEPKYLTYKTECAELADGLFGKVQLLYILLQEAEDNE